MPVFVNPVCIYISFSSILILLVGFRRSLFVARYYYSTQPFLAWCLNHYFYGGVHFVWVGAPFYPYRLDNPRSSSPFRKYEDLYELWKDEDEFSPYLEGTRAGLHKGILANLGRLHPQEVVRLHDVCDRIHTVFFYPIVYRIDVDRIDPARLQVANSGLKGSQEYRITALHEPEFDILFFDADTEIVPRSFRDFWAGSLPKANIWNIFGHWMTI